MSISRAINTIYIEGKWYLIRPLNEYNKTIS